jgi:hypothetical protein
MKRVDRVFVFADEVSRLYIPWRRFPVGFIRHKISPFRDCAEKRQYPKILAIGTWSLEAI